VLLVAIFSIFSNLHFERMIHDVFWSCSEDQFHSCMHLWLAPLQLLGRRQWLLNRLMMDGGKDLRLAGL